MEVPMDLAILKKKISTFKGEGGRLRKVNDSLLIEILHAWENWTGTGKDFYYALGVSSKKMAKLIGKAKRLKREGVFPESEFKEVEVEEESKPTLPAHEAAIEVIWDKTKIIRFNNVSLLLDFLKKAA